MPRSSRHGNNEALTYNRRLARRFGRLVCAKSQPARPRLLEAREARGASRVRKNAMPQAPPAGWAPCRGSTPWSVLLQFSRRPGAVVGFCESQPLRTSQVDRFVVRAQEGRREGREGGRDTPLVEYNSFRSHPHERRANGRTCRGHLLVHVFLPEVAENS